MILKCLFIGGPADGERRAVEDYMTVCCVHEFPPLPPLLDMKMEQAVTLKITRHHYVRVKMPDDWYVYVHDSLHPREIIGKLIRGYRSSNSL